MDVLLSRMTQQAMNYAIRSGVTIATTYTIKQCGRLLKETPKGKEREEIAQLQLRLESKIRVISPAIDMIELISARGNTSLESAIMLTKDIRCDIQNLGVRLSNAASGEELRRGNSSRARTREETDRELYGIIAEMKKLLFRIEDAVPLISLAITTSGVNLSTKLSGTISPSRLLQASTFLSSADIQYGSNACQRAQVGPTFVVSLYMLFAGHAWRPVDEAGIRETTWKEVIHKARIKLVRLPLDQLYHLPNEQHLSIPADLFRESTATAEFAYHLLIVEDLDDDRVHTFESDDEQPGPFDELPNAGIRDVVPIHEISKVFYADTGKILNIGAEGETNNPVLLIKRDIHAEPPRRMYNRSSSIENACASSESGPRVPREGSSDSRPFEVDDRMESLPDTPEKGQMPLDRNSTWRLPGDLDPKWMALEVYAENVESEDGEQDADLCSSSICRSSELSLNSALANMSIRSMAASPVAPQQSGPTVVSTLQASPDKRAGPPIKTSLSLMEMLVKLAALQQFRQESHLAIEDELLNFFLEDGSTAGVGADKDDRQRIRHDAIRRVGFDPYDESPIKRRNEQYIQNPRGAASPRPTLSTAFHAGNLPYDSEYGYEDDPGSSNLSPIQDVLGEKQDGLLSSPPAVFAHVQQTPSRSSTLMSSGPATPLTNVNDRVGRDSHCHPATSSTPPDHPSTRQSVPRASSEDVVRSLRGHGA